MELPATLDDLFASMKRHGVARFESAGYNGGAELKIYLPVVVSAPAAKVAGVETEERSAIDLALHPPVVRERDE